ncbi:Non-specific serine/threonine protein kinase protein, partial [Dioscorea alata]
VGVGIGVFLLSFAFCFAWHRHQKRREGSPSSNPLIGSSYAETTSRRGDPELGSPTFQTHFFSYQELQEATNDFNVSNELGDGGYSTVYKGKLKDGRTVAVKRLYNNNYKRIEQFLNEVKILSCLRHQNLVTLYGCTPPESQELLLVYEFIPNGTIADHLHGSRSNQKNLTWPLRMSIAIEIAEALTYLHAIDPLIIHRDVKTNNILVDNNFHAKVADFGLSKLCPTDATHISTAPQGTPGYLDPEYHQCFQLTNKSDVYSFGVVLVELISSKLAVDLKRQTSEINLASMAIHKIENCELEQLVDPFLGYQSNKVVKMAISQMAELAFICLQGEKEMRPTMKDVLEMLKDIESKMQILQNTETLSPNSVVDNWPSRGSTP